MARLNAGMRVRRFFFENGSVRGDLTRAGQYARLLASVGIDGCTINNVNADRRILDDSFIPQLARIADVFRPWGVRLAVSVDLSSPKTSGGLDTFDPLDPRVVEWWKAKVDTIYRQIPDFGGIRGQSGFGGPRGSIIVRADAGGRGQRDCARAAAPWRRAFLSRIRL
jgi:alpha-glucuronidase